MAIPDARILDGKPASLESYYDVIALTGGEFSFLSPTQWRPWLISAAEWLRRGKIVAEVGCGYGELATEALRVRGRIREYYGIDVSGKMLEKARESTSRIDGKRFKPVKHDILNGPPGDHILPGSVDRLAMINVLQDIDAETVLLNVRPLMKRTGEVRMTFIRREVQDIFWKDAPNYDGARGWLYNTSPLHEASKSPPIGFIVQGGCERPFYRVQHYFTTSDIHSILSKLGYAIERIEPVTFPVSLVLVRWSSELHRTSLSQRQLDLLEEWGGFPDAWDVLARLEQ